MDDDLSDESVDDSESLSLVLAGAGLEAGEEIFDVGVLLFKSREKVSERRDYRKRIGTNIDLDFVADLEGSSGSHLAGGGKRKDGWGAEVDGAGREEDGKKKDFVRSQLREHPSDRD